MKKNLKCIIIFLVTLSIMIGATYFSFHYIYRDGIFSGWYEDFCYFLCIILSGYFTYMLKDL